MLIKSKEIADLERPALRGLYDPVSTPCPNHRMEFLTRIDRGDHEVIYRLFNAHLGEVLPMGQV